MTERETDTVNRFSKLGMDGTRPIDGSQFKASGMAAQSGSALMNQTRAAVEPQWENGSLGFLSFF